MRLSVQFNVLIWLAFDLLEEPFAIVHILPSILYCEYSLGQIDGNHRRIDLIAQTALIIVDLLPHTEIAVRIICDASLLTHFFQDTIDSVYPGVVLLFKL